MLRFKLEQAAYFHYDRMLTSKMKALYKKLLNAMLHFKVEIKLEDEFSDKEIHDVLYAIIYDRPDIFWFRGACTLHCKGSVNTGIDLRYTYTKAQAYDIVGKILQSRFFREADALMAKQGSEFDKALRLYEYIIKNTEYDVTASESDNDKQYEYAYGLEGVMLKGAAVCAGYAKAFQYFMNRHNIWCTYLRGEGAKENHGWNMIRLFKEFYQLDCTWGDPVFAESEAKDPDFIRYDYFCFTSDECKTMGYPTCTFSIPPCTATRCNYYRYFGLYQESFSLNEVARIIKQAKQAGKKSAVIKYADEATFTTASQELFENHKAFDALEMAGIKLSNINYSRHEKLRLIEISLV